MIAILFVTVLFVCISIYFFLRAEKLQHTIVSIKRDTSKTKTENQALSKSMTLIASNTEEFVKSRLQSLLNKEQCQDELMLIQPIMENYSIIFKECLVKKGKLHVSVKKCFASVGEDAYKEFFEVCVKKDEKINRLWNNNNFIGFISLVEALLVKYEEKSQCKPAEEKPSAA